ncbi:SDR family NAD(P)-dependent oxidoreductase [Rhodococcus sp. IEGM1428]|uniref:SDR family NAD(P)-dependent oxidoreductase n=1 Tax=Rhodococcus sp. IEGM1428 TaxID=3392191 RepID=UPI003D09DDA1
MSPLDAVAESHVTDGPLPAPVGNSSEFAAKSVLITGGGSGIGAGTARLMAENGAYVVVLGPDEKPLSEVAAAVRGVAIVGDASDSNDVDAAIRAAREATGQLDILISCAGISPFGSATDTTDELWGRVGRVNLDTAFVAARQCLPALIESRGSIVLVSSLAGLLSAPNAVAYTTTKHAIIGLTRSLAGDYGPRGVRTNAVCPGFVRTAMSDSVMTELGGLDGADALEAAYVSATRFTPLRRPAATREIAEVIAFLAGPRSTAITGSVITADGGVSAIETGTIAAFA